MLPRGLAPSCLALLLAVSAAPSVRAQCEVDKVHADLPQAIAQFGTSVAISGDRLVVGTPFGNSNGQPGVVDVYQLGPTGWEFQAQLLADDPDPDNFNDFGIAVAIDGDTILVGADLVDGPLSGGVGAVYAFAWDGVQWIRTQKLQASDGASGGFFGYAVALDGDTAVIGRYWDSAAALHAGSAYVFTRTNDVWSQTQKLLPTHPQPEDNYGYSLALSGDRLLVGAPERFSAGVSDQQFGHAFVYDRTGATWTQAAVLFGSGPLQYDQFGISVDIDGDQLVVGAWQELFSPPFSHNGKAYVFERNGTAWTESQVLVAEDGQVEDEFGASVAIEDDSLLVGAAARDAFPLFGGIYVYGKGTRGWEQTDLFLPVANTSLSFLGNALALDGNHAVAGAFNETFGVFESGVAYVYGGFLEAFTDEGFALAGTTGLPALEASGTLCPGATVALSLSNAKPSSAMLLIIGFDTAFVPFLGGTLVPSPDVVISGLSTSPTGTLAVSAPWPVGVPPLTTLALQAWIADPAGPHGAAASNGVSTVTP